MLAQSLGGPRTDRPDPDAFQGPGGLSTYVGPALAWGQGGRHSCKGVFEL